MEISWKLESSATTTWSGEMDSISGSRGLPIFPPRCTVLPSAFKNSERRVVVVVLPSLPVTAYILQGQSLKKSSISLVTAWPCLRAASSSGRWKGIPGVRKIISSLRSWR